MTAAVLATASEAEPTSWPDAVIFLGVVALIGFLAWVVLR